MPDNLFNVEEIPKEFYSIETGKLFTNCKICNKNLLYYNVVYVIEKAFQKKIGKNEFELIFEYAVCDDCSMKLSKEFSQESLKNIDMYFKLYQENYNRKKTIDEILSSCMVTNKAVNEMKEYQIAGIFNNNMMLPIKYFPFAIGEYAMEEIQELLSKKTKKILDGHKDLLLPPKIRDRVPKDRLVFI